MAIMNVTDEQYDKIQEIIIDVLENRKLMFTKPLIIKIIENKLIEAGMEATRVNDIYFNLMGFNCFRYSRIKFCSFGGCLYLCIGMRGEPQPLFS